MTECQNKQNRKTNEILEYNKEIELILLEMIEEVKVRTFSCIQVITICD